MSTIDKISLAIDSASLADKEEALIEARLRIERLEAALGVVVEQAKRDELSAATLYNAEALLYE